MTSVPLTTHQFPSNNSVFHQTLSIFHQVFDFSHTRMPDLVITTHLGLPSPPTIDWPSIPPTCWPSATFCPTPHRFLSISHPIRLSVRLFVCQPTHLSNLIRLAPTSNPPIRPSIQHISTHLFTNSIWTPSVCPTQVHPHPPVWAWSPLTHLSVQAPCLPLSVCHHHWVIFMSNKDIVYIFLKKKYIPFFFWTLLLPGSPASEGS